MEPPATSFSVTADGDPFEQLLAQVREAAAGVYDVLGEMGRSRGGNVVYLAREIESGFLVALKLTRAAEGSEGEFDLNVVRTLDESIPGLENRCPECRELLPDWDRFCFHCGADLSSASFATTEGEADVLLDAVREATAGDYEILGRMSKAEGGGVVFFARDQQRGKLVALRLKKEAATADEQGYSIGETQLFRPLAAELAATQLAPQGLLSRPPAAAPAPQPAPPPVAPARRDAAPPPAAPASDDASPPGTGFTQPLPLVSHGTSRRTLLLAGGVLVAIVAVIGTVLATSDDNERVAAPAPADTVATVPMDTVASAPETPPVVVPPTGATTAVVADSGALRAVGLPAAAHVTIDGRPVRRWPALLPAGAHEVLLVAVGYDTVRQQVTLRAGEIQRWQPRLVPRPVVSTPAPASTSSGGVSSAKTLPTCARAMAKGDWTQASSLCQLEGNTGNHEAQRHFAELVAAGHGVAADDKLAATWYTRAAVGGDREAQERLGYLYRAGTGVPRDEKKSAEWFRRAAEAGAPVGMMEYGVALDGGRGVDRDDARAAEWFQKASDAGNGVATRRLARLYERGEGVKKNEAQAFELYKSAAERGDAEAEYQVGRFMVDGRGGAPKDQAQALEWFRKAAAQGHPAAAEEVKRRAR